MERELEKYVEDYSDEIIQTLVDSYNDDKSLLGYMMLYLLSEVKSDYFADSIIEVLDDLEICTECGTPLIEFKYKEKHPELEHDNIEEKTVLLCPKCDLNN